jgi:hypothetical protein
MIPKVVGVAQNEIGQRTDLNADVFLDVLLHKIGEQEQLKGVANSLGVKQDSIMQVSNIFVVSLACMTESSHFISR